MSREKLRPDITDPGLRKVLDIVPYLRRLYAETLNAQMLTSVPVRIGLRGRELDAYLHSADASGGARPVVLELHGGGFLFGDARRCDRFCRSLSLRLNCHVISLAYRLGPEYPYPAALDDTVDTVLWVRDHAADFGFDPDRTALMGYSAGANLAAACAIFCKKTGEDLVRALALHYPFLDLASLPDRKQKRDGETDPELVRAFTLLYAGAEARRTPFVSPVCAKREDLEGTAPALILPAECDSLLEEGLLYARMLTEAGVETECSVMKNMHHGYIEDAGNEKLFQNLTGSEFLAGMKREADLSAETAVRLTGDFFQRQFWGLKLC